MTMTALTPQEQADIERRFAQFDPATATVYEAGDDVPADLRLVEAAAARALYLRQADAVMRGAVDDARGRGWSWHKIGQVLGTTGEAVRQRYSHA